MPRAHAVSWMGPVSKPSYRRAIPGQAQRAETTAEHGTRFVPGWAWAHLHSCRAVPVPSRNNGLRAGLSGRGLSGHLYPIASLSRSNASNPKDTLNLGTLVSQTSLGPSSLGCACPGTRLGAQLLGQGPEAVSCFREEDVHGELPLLVTALLVREPEQVAVRCNVRGRRLCWT
jgi:hypothetical protein